MFLSFSFMKGRS